MKLGLISGRVWLFVGGLIGCFLMLLLYDYYNFDKSQAKGGEMIHLLNGNVGVNNVFKSADLTGDLPDNLLKMVSAVEVHEARVEVEAFGRKVFYRDAKPPQGNFAKAEILLLHGQAFSSANWMEKQTMQTLAAAGYHVVAVDLPGYGRTAGNSLSAEEKPEFLKSLIESLAFDRPVLVSPSMSGSYAVPHFMKHQAKLLAFVAIAPVDTGKFDFSQYRANKLPTLIIHGSRDTSLGVSSASNLKQLPNGRIYKIEKAGHACYLDNPLEFHAALLNFLELVRTYTI